MTGGGRDRRDEVERERVGLCASCAHARVVASERGSRFYLCERSRTDPAFPRYPRLPVVACLGWDPGTGRRFGSIE